MSQNWGQVQRDTPTSPDVLIPSVLTEDEESISRYVALLEGNDRQRFCDLAREYLIRAINEGVQHELVDAKLRALSYSAEP